VEGRLAQLDQLYSVVQSEHYDQQMFWLELLVVILCTIEVLALFVLKR
jgi:hypothetical protein